MAATSTSAAIRLNEARSRLVLARGSEIVTGSPEELAETLKRDIPKYKKLMVEAGIVPQ